MSQGECLHMQGGLDQVWYITDDNLPSDIKATKGSSFDDVSWIVGLSRVDRENFLIVDIHLGPEKVKEHEPGTKESVLINTCEKAGQVLIDQDQIGVDRRRSQYREQSVHVACSEMIWTCRRDKLEDESGKNVEHWSEWGVDKGNNRPSAAEVFLPFGQNIPRWELATRSHCPRICTSVLALKGFNQRGHD